MEEEQQTVKKKMKMQHESIDININSLPDDLLANIISHLPTNTLLQCKTVCKQWHHLITHHSKLPQLHHTNNNNNNNIMALLQPWCRSTRLLTIDPQGNKVSSLRPIDYIDRNKHVDLLVSSHGLFLCTITSPDDEQHQQQQYAVVNPITANYTLLPSVPDQYCNEGFRIHGFTFTPSSNEYTAFVFGTWKSEFISGTWKSIWCQVFDSSTNAWQSAPSSPLLDDACLYPNYRKAIYSHGSVYVLTYTIDDDNEEFYYSAALLALDIAKGEWRRIPMPKGCCCTGRVTEVTLRLLELGDSDVAVYDVVDYNGEHLPGPWPITVWRLLPKTEEWVLVEELEYSSSRTDPVVLSLSIFFFLDSDKWKMVAYDREHKTWENIDLPIWGRNDSYYGASSSCFRPSIFSP